MTGDGRQVQPGSPVRGGPSRRGSAVAVEVCTSPHQGGSRLLRVVLVASALGLSALPTAARAGAAPRLVYATYVGHAGGITAAQGVAVAIDASANAYVVGSTASANFPTHGAAMGVLTGTSDAFLAAYSIGLRP